MLPALIALTSTMLAPAPVYRDRPLTPKERQSLLKAALDEMDSATAEAKSMNSGTKAEWAEHAKRYKAKNSSAGEKLSRILIGMPAGPERFRVATKAAEAWGQAGKDEKALANYKDAAEQAPDGNSRVRALWGVRVCYLRLGKKVEGEKATKRMLEEAEALGKSVGQEWKRMLASEERMVERVRRLK